MYIYTNMYIYTCIYIHTQTCIYVWIILSTTISDFGNVRAWIYDEIDKRSSSSILRKTIPEPQTGIVLNGSYKWF